MFQWGRKTFMLVTGMLCSVSSCEVWGLAVPVAYTTAADLGSGHLTGIDEAVVEFHLIRFCAQSIVTAER